jgi:hypothetical protein
LGRKGTVTVKPVIARTVRCLRRGGDDSRPQNPSFRPNHADRLAHGARKGQFNGFSTKRPPNNHDFRLSIGLVFLEDKRMAQFSEEGLGHLLQVSRRARLRSVKNVTPRLLVE